jgi:enamine deaminase RidA (YjgF/YER057c/UK114 family)
MAAIVEKLAQLGYIYEPATLQKRTFHVAVRSGNLVFTSGQLPEVGDVSIKGKVGTDIDLPTAQKAAELCAFNCLRAVGAVVDVESISRVIKMFGMVNLGEGFTDTSGVINGATDLLNALFGPEKTHARSAVGMTLPANWAVEIELVVEVRD